MTDLFALADAPKVTTAKLNGEIPVMVLDGIYRDAAAVRQAALRLPYAATDTFYPGRVASLDGDPSLQAFLAHVTQVVEQRYLPLLPGLPDGRKPTHVAGLKADFAIVDRPPEQLHPLQRRPHVDAVPIFGLVYLNQEERGGTLFFKPRQGPAAERHGYQTTSDGAFELCGRIEGRFNRLAIYPGFIPHSGEIAGPWIEGEERTRHPRLTQRLQFQV